MYGNGSIATTGFAPSLASQLAATPKPVSALDEILSRLNNVGNRLGMLVAQQESAVETLRGPTLKPATSTGSVPPSSDPVGVLTRLHGELTNAEELLSRLEMATHDIAALVA